MEVADRDGYHPEPNQPQGGCLLQIAEDVGDPQARRDQGRKTQKTAHENKGNAGGNNPVFGQLRGGRGQRARFSHSWPVLGQLPGMLE